MPRRADSPTKTCTQAGCSRPLRARGLCSTHYNQRDPDRHRRVLKPCEACGKPVMREDRDRYRVACSTRCRNILTRGHPEGARYTWEADAMARARKAGAHRIELVDRDQVGARDGWTCQVCHLPVDRTADPLDPWAPSIDHVVPLSRGGQHCMENVQLLHFGCNSSKQDDSRAPSFTQATL